jgi:large subunit ribosomal protein L25
MKTLSISGTARKATGAKNALELRRTGTVPCVLYGGKEQVTHFSVNEKQFAKLLYTPDAYLVTLDLDGKQTQAIVQEAQFNRVTDELLHVDFLEAKAGKTVTVKIPVVTHGSPKGVKMGGKLQVKLRRLKVKGLVENIPDKITLEVEHLELGESILVREMKNDKLKFLDPANAAVITVRTTREAEAAAPAPGASAAATTAAAPAAAAPAAEAKKEEKPAAKK